MDCRIRQTATASPAEPGGLLLTLADIKAQVALPETADELWAVAEGVKADAARDIRLGSQATEREVKRLSASGELATYRMVHFATHGAVAGELTGTHEPGLILTPPETASEADDGYLSASEVAALKLDADWVVLSACNTRRVGRRTPRRCRVWGGPSSTPGHGRCWCHTGRLTPTPPSS